MASIFTKIVNGEIPSHKIAEENDFLAFLDVNPLVEGHVLCIPKKEVDYIYDLEDDTLQRLMLFSKKVAKGLETAIPCKRIGVAVIGLEVPHAHVHLIPISEMNDMNFSRPKMNPSQEELILTAEKIKSQL